MKRLAIFVIPSLLLGSMALAVLAFANEKMKVVYHLNESDKAYWVLDIIRDHVNTVGADNVEITLVTHGPALKVFHQKTGSLDVKGIVEELQVGGVKFDACGFTMKFFNYSTSDLLPDMVRRDEGGTVRIAELQSEGYIYIRP